MAMNTKRPEIEKVVITTARLYQARDTMKALLPTTYPQRIAEYQAFIRRAADRVGGDVLKAVLAICACVSGATEDEVRIGQAMVLAAYVEMVEPSNKGGD
jgi:hypothetical protein